MTESSEVKSSDHFFLESGKMDNSLDEKHKEWVIAAIDQIRQRKARPDLPRLCSTLQRRHGLSKTKIQTIIDKLVEEKLIFKVFFKGQCSYRSAKTRFKHDAVKSLSTSNRLTQGIRAIMKQTGDSVSFKELETWLLGRNPETKLVKNRLEVALKREIEANTITRLSDYSYVLTESLPTKEKKEERPVVPTTTPKKLTLIEKTDAQNSSAKRPGRPKKKIGNLEGQKKNEDPDYELPACYKTKKAEKLTCDICLKSAENKEGKKFLLICKDCSAKAHPSCMNYSEELATKARNYPWQCIDCKVCCVCGGAGDASSLLFCDSCDKGYHMACHKPAVSIKPKGKWLCGQCKLEKKSPPGVKEKMTAESENQDQTNKTCEKSEQVPVEVDLSVSRRGRKRKLKENFGDFVGFKRRSTTSSLNHSTTSSLDQSVKETTQEEPPLNEFTDGTEGASCLPTPSASPRLGDTFDLTTATNPSSSSLNAMNRNSEEGLPTMKKGNSVRVINRSTAVEGGHYMVWVDEKTVVIELGISKIYQLKMSESVIPLHINDTATYPNASKWSIKEVVKYFTELGFTSEAQAFKDQEIDGRSLLLMKRNDVLTGLAIRLGPALKIYQKIYKLQTVGQLSS